MNRRSRADSSGPFATPRYHQPTRRASVSREALDEVDLWVQDERQWRNTRGHNWESLLSDLTQAVEFSGGALAASGVKVSAILEAVKECAALLRQTGDKSPDEDLRQRLIRQMRDLQRTAAAPEALIFAFDATVEAATAEDQDDGAARVLLDLARIAGRDPHMVASELADLAHGKEQAIAAARPILGTDEANQHGELALEARIELARRWLGAPFQMGDSVVWLSMWSARIDPEPSATIGPCVQLFDGPWIFNQMNLAAEDRDPALPPELTTAVESDVESFVLSHQPDNDTEPAIAFLRIAITDPVEAEVLDRARETVELLTGLASLHGAPRTLWILRDSYLILVAGETHHGTVPGALKESPHKLDQIDLLRDTTLNVLRSEADALGSKLPATDPQLRAAGRLLGWLRDAAGAPRRLDSC